MGYTITCNYLRKAHNLQTDLEWINKEPSCVSRLSVMCHSTEKMANKYLHKKLKYARDETLVQLNARDVFWGDCSRLSLHVPCRARTC